MGLLVVHEPLLDGVLHFLKKSAQSVHFLNY